MSTWEAEKYEQWFATPKGEFALASERKLLENMVAGWPRRCTKLLEIGCGTGLFLESLWHMGFEVTGVDLSPVMVEAARKRFGNRADIHMGNGELLPYEDGEFDFVLIWSMLEFCSDPGAVLREAARVAEKGILVGFLNRWSFYYQSHGKERDHTLGKARWYTWPQMKRMIQVNVGRSPQSAKSVLAGPVSTWRTGFPYQHFNTRLLSPYFGAFTAARIDFKNVRPLTPIMSWINEAEPEAG